MFFKALLISIFSDVCKIQAIIPALASILFQKIMIVIPLLGIAASPQLVSNIRKGILTPVGKAFLFFSAWLVLSVPFSIYPGGSFGFVTDDFWKLFLYFCLILAYGISREKINSMIWAFILAVALFAVIAFLHGGTGRFQFIEAYDANENALLFVVCFPFAFWQVITMKGWKKMVTAGLCVLLVIGVISTDSRGGFLGLLAVGTICIFQYRRVRRVRLLPFLFIPALIFGVMFFYGGASYKERIESIFDTKTNYNYSSNQGRLALWREGVDMMIHHPLVGVGVTQFYTAHGRLYRAENGGLWQAPHNFLIQVGSELGFPGLIAYCFILAGIVKKMRRATARQNASEGKFSVDLVMSYSLTGAWTAFIVCGSFLSVAYSSIFFLLLGVSLAFLNLIAGPAEVKEAVHEPKDIPETGNAPVLRPAALASQRQYLDRKQMRRR